MPQKSLRNSSLNILMITLIREIIVTRFKKSNASCDLEYDNVETDEYESRSKNNNNCFNQFLL